jgi:quinol monooxygenase YgiN
MKAASIHEIKKELLTLAPKEILELCLRLARHKKENKELLTYLLYEAHDETKFIEEVRQLMDEQWKDINVSQVYLAKKTLRKVLRTAAKFIRFAASDRVGVELLLHFCVKLKTSGLPLTANTVLGNMFVQQIKKLNAHLASVHEDLQYDYHQRIQAVGL